MAWVLKEPKASTEPSRQLVQHSLHLYSCLLCFKRGGNVCCVISVQSQRGVSCCGDIVGEDRVANGREAAALGGARQDGSLGGQCIFHSHSEGAVGEEPSDDEYLVTGGAIGRPAGSSPLVPHPVERLLHVEECGDGDSLFVKIGDRKVEEARQLESGAVFPPESKLFGAGSDVLRHVV